MRSAIPTAQQGTPGDQRCFVTIADERRFPKRLGQDEPGDDARARRARRPVPVDFYGDDIAWPRVDPEATFAAEGVEGLLRYDPMSMRPFMSYPEGAACRFALRRSGFGSTRG